MKWPLRGAYFALFMMVGMQAAWAEDEDWPLSTRLLNSFSEGNTIRVIALAPAVLLDEPNNHELRMALAHSLSWSGDAFGASVQYRSLLGTEYDAPAKLGLANSLSWSGQPSQAVPYYQSLQGTPFEKDTWLGLANALRWTGRPDLALAHYQAAQKQESTREDAILGMELTRKELRPRSWIANIADIDNSPFKRTDWILGHRWRSPGAATIFSLEQSIASDEGASSNRQAQEWTGRIEPTDWWLKPLFTLGQGSAPNTVNLAHVRLRLGDDLHFLNFGQINWGKQSFNMMALDQALTARQFGIDSKLQTPLGAWHAVISRFDISDGNHINNGDISLIPIWRPLGPNLHTKIGTSWRYANRNTDTYWSPAKFSVFYVGLEGQWDFGNGTATAYVSGGAPLDGDSSRSWSIGINIQRWINRDWFIKGNAGMQTSTQGTNYESRTIGLSLEKLW